MDGMFCLGDVWCFGFGGDWGGDRLFFLHSALLFVVNNIMISLLPD